MEKVGKVSGSLHALAKAASRTVSRAPTSAELDLAPKGYDLRHVRIHRDEDAANAAAQLGARGFNIGEHVILGRNAGPETLRHELVHAAQQPTPTAPITSIAPANGEHERVASGAAPLQIQRAAPGTMFLDRDPAAHAVYPSRDERSDILGIAPLATGQQTSAPAAATAKPTGDPVEFQTRMTAVIADHIQKRLPRATAIGASSVELGSSDLDSLAAIAEESVVSEFGPYIRAGGTDLTKIHLRDRLKLIPRPEDTSDEHIAGLSQDFVTTLMQLETDLLDQFGVSADSDLFTAVRDAIVLAHKDELKTLVLFIGGYETPSHSAFVQRRIAPEYKNEPESRTRRRGRWEALGTTMHEMLHSVAHTQFSEVADSLQRPDLLIEGGAEIFTKEIYDTLAERAGHDEALRTRVEGEPGPFLSPPERHSAYEGWVAQLEQITTILGGNRENLRAAFFMGRMELIGLGSWNESEADRRFPARFPAWDLGLAFVGSSNLGSRAAQIRLGRVVLGRTGNAQLRFEGIVSLRGGQGSGVGLAGGVSVLEQGRNAFVSAGLGIGGSRNGGLGLESIAHLEAGARLGRFRAGADLEVYVPITGGQGEQTLRVLAGLGISVTF